MRRISIAAAVSFTGDCVSGSGRRRRRLRLTNKRLHRWQRSILYLSILFLFLTSANALIASSPELVDAVEPYVAHLKLKPEQLRALADKLVVARALLADNDKEMAAIGAVLSDATPDAFVESYKTLATFRQNPYIVASGKFGDKPSLSDLDGLTLEDRDLNALTKPELKGSEIKLSQSEIARFRAIGATASRLTPQLKARLTTEFKKMVVERVRNYRGAGLPPLASTRTKKNPSTRTTRSSLWRASLPGRGSTARISTRTSKAIRGTRNLRANP